MNTKKDIYKGKFKLLLLKNANIIDLYTGDIDYNKDVFITGDRITEVLDSRYEIDNLDLALNVVNCKNKYLIPGLWDMHIHILNNADLAIPHLIANGVLGIRDMGSSFSEIEHLKSKLEKESLPINLFFTGPILDNKIIPGTNSRINVNGSEDIQSIVAKLYGFGVDYIKVHYNIPYEKYLELIKTAKKFKLDVVGHVPYGVRIIDAINLGQKSIEHLTGMFLGSSHLESSLREKYVNAKNNMIAEMNEKEAANTFDEEKFEQIVETSLKKNVYHVPTLRIMKAATSELIDSKPDFYKYIPEELIDSMENFSAEIKKASLISFFDFMYDCKKRLVKKMYEMDLPILVGTDSHCSMLGDQFKIFYGCSVHEEMEELVDCNFSNLAALQSATIKPVEFLNLTKDFGKIEADKIADFLILNSNPLEDIRNTRDIEYIVLKGNIKAI